MKTWRQTEIEDILICPERYRRNHLTDEVRGDSAAQLMGTAVHDTLAGSLTALRDWGLLDEASRVGSFARSRFAKLMWEDTKSADPIPWRENAVDERADEVEVMASFLWAAMPGILETYGGPMMIEHTFSEAPLPRSLNDELLDAAGDEEAVGELGLNGTWDLLTDKHILIDFKTSANSWRPGIEHKKVQPIVYARGVEHVTGRWPDGFIFVVVNRRGVVNIKPVDVSRERYAFLEKLLPPLERMRLNNIFPMNPDSNLCTEVYCPWFTRGCPAGSFKGLPHDLPGE